MVTIRHVVSCSLVSGWIMIYYQQLPDRQRERERVVSGWHDEYKVCICTTHCCNHILYLWHHLYFGSVFQGTALYNMSYCLFPRYYNVRDIFLGITYAFWILVMSWENSMGKIVLSLIQLDHYKKDWVKIININTCYIMWALMDS